MKLADAQTIIEQYLAFVSEGDADGIMSLYAQECTLEDPVGSGVKQGFDEVKAFYSALNGMKLTAKLSGPVRFTDEGLAAAFPFTIDVPLEDSTMKQDIIDVFRFNEEGKIIQMQAFWGSENASFG